MRAWLVLLALSAVSTAFAASGLRGTVFAVLVVSLAGAKAHVILTQYLGLAAAPQIRTGFDVALAAFLFLVTALAVAA